MKNSKESDHEDQPLSDPKDKMYRTLNNGSLVVGISLKDIIFRCGELQMDYTNVCWLCRDICDPKTLMQRLHDPETEAYGWYQSGVAQGNLKLNIDLEYNVGDPKAKDAYKHLSAERRRQAINRKLEELFGVGE
ncbi:MAG TPA: hypothetical protein DEQ30_02975 [Porphyromonadaceae bacterium]|nr:hypothetical protein [Porphyromonadaceae bacterium]